MSHTTQGVVFMLSSSRHITPTTKRTHTRYFCRVVFVYVIIYEKTEEGVLLVWWCWEKGAPQTYKNYNYYINHYLPFLFSGCWLKTCKTV